MNEKAIFAVHRIAIFLVHTIATLTVHEIAILSQNKILIKVLQISPSSSDIERFFSQMNVVMHDRRSRMLPKTILDRAVAAKSEEFIAAVNAITGEAENISSYKPQTRLIRSPQISSNASKLT